MSGGTLWDGSFAVVLGCPIEQWAAPETCAQSLFCNVLHLFVNPSAGIAEV